MKKCWGSTKDERNASHQVLNRSTYSLVSCSDLDAETWHLWMDLPDQVKLDPSLEQIRRRYEEIGKTQSSKSKVPEIKTASLKHIASESILEKEESISYKVEDIIKEEDGEVETEHPPRVKCKKSSKLSQAKYYTKIVLLVGCWMFFTAVFMMYDDKVVVTTNVAVTSNDITEYHVKSGKAGRMELKMVGSFIPGQRQVHLDPSRYQEYQQVRVWIPSNNNTNLTERTLLLANTYTTEVRKYLFHLEADRNYTVLMETDSLKAVPILVSYDPSPIDATTGVVFALVLLCGLYILIVFEIMSRTLASMMVCTCSLAALALVGQRPSLRVFTTWLDVETLLLLFSMMLLVAIMAETGIFDYLAVFAFEITKGKLWPLVLLLCFITAIMSTFLDNVTTVLLMSPVTIRLCEVMDLDPVPILMLMAIYSNIGGTATPVGDPPNVIVASNRAVIDAGINFTNFTAHMALGVALVCVQTTLHVRYIYRDTGKLRLRVPREIQEIRNQISIWRRAADSLPHLSNGFSVVRERLERKIKKLNIQLEKMIKESYKRACPKEVFLTTLADLKDKHKIRDKPLLVKSALAIGFVVVVFFLHSLPELNRVSLAWTAFLGAILLLVLADRADLEPILHRVEWSTLLFFASLFVLMEALAEFGLIMYIGMCMERLILLVRESARLPVALMVILWVSGMISAFVDNIPLTTMMIRVVVAIGQNPLINLPMAPLVWSLLFGACLGGNGTLIGASANIVCAGVAQQHGYKFSFFQFFKLGFPIMIGHFITASIYLLICHCVFTWH